jgi:hypothetical protein
VAPGLLLDFLIMQLVQGLLCTLALGVGYMLFFHSQPNVNAVKAVPNAVKAVSTAQNQPRAAGPHDPYKASLDRAHVVADQMNAAHKEANSF